ncbi:formyltransferase family protein [Devosia sediminis]|uniref:UDP-glucuronic acid dehydrogenase n=1 Tax=Devosia sediminis TaxID=2798801 RepID=A0A934MLD6_9HYPH|nr:formyltransferase family protein [Devosia sediminis]MBJ3785055.1 UDP-glucuronic acid dehydrogenase [Devosia sediminis]
MKITVLCSSSQHPIFPRLAAWQNAMADQHEVELVNRRADLSGGDLLLLISASEIIASDDRAKYRKSLVIHASDLPQGRGWSPHIWQILEGRTRIVVTLLEAQDRVDSGDIWHQVHCDIPDYALFDEINDSIFDAELELMDFAVDNFETVVPRAQDTSIEPSYYPRRTPSDSQIDPHRTIAEQFDLLRVTDPIRFPAFFEYRNHTYKIQIVRDDDEHN